MIPFVLHGELPYPMCLAYIITNWFVLNWLFQTSFPIFDLEIHNSGTESFNCTNKSIINVSCDDTTAFKSIADLISLYYLKDFYQCTSTKEVPGLGSILWNANARVNIQNGELHFNFHNGLQNNNSILLRENLVFIKVPMETGFYEVYGHIQLDPSLVYGGYGRFGDDGDVSDGLWEVDSMCTNYIEIAHIDLDCMEVYGSFEVHLKMVEQGQFGVLYSERINFLNGKFTTRIFNF